MIEKRLVLSGIRPFPCVARTSSRSRQSSSKNKKKKPSLTFPAKIRLSAHTKLAFAAFYMCTTNHRQSSAPTHLPKHHNGDKPRTSSVQRNDVIANRNVGDALSDRLDLRITNHESSQIAGAKGAINQRATYDSATLVSKNNGEQTLFDKFTSTTRQLHDPGGTK